MNKGVIKKISVVCLAAIVILTGKVMATDTREQTQGKIQESTINSMLYDKSLGYSASFDLRNYNDITIQSPGTTNANWALVAADLMEISNNSDIEVSARHINYATAYDSVSSGTNTNAHNRTLGTAANMRVALGYFTSGRGPVAESDFKWSSNLAKVSSSTITSKKTIGILESYRIFPSIYKMSYDNGKGKMITYAYNDPIIYTVSTNQTGGKIAASKDLRPYTGGEIEQVREEIKGHIVEHGAVSARIYRNSTNYYVYRLDGQKEKHYYEHDDGESSWTDSQWERHYTQVSTISYYCSKGKLTPNHDVIIIGWDDSYQVPGAPGIGAYIVMDSEAFATTYYKDWYETFNKWGGKPGWEHLEGRYYLAPDEKTKVEINTNYYYVSYYDYYIESEVYGLKDFSYSKYNNTYQYDPLGMSTSIEPENLSTIAYGANVFDRGANALPETLNAISIASESDMKYEIYVNTKDSTLSSEKLIKVAETDVLKAGYNTIKLDSIVVLTGRYFAVAVKYVMPQEAHVTSMARIGVEAPKQKMYTMISTNKTETSYDPITYWNGKATASKGQSFIGSSLDNWTDLNSKAETKGANICIKAFTTLNKNYKVKVEKIEIMNSGKVATEPIQVIKGDTVKLNANISPADAADKSVTWVSDNRSIATVDKTGLVTTHAAGKVKITAISSNATIKTECTIDVRVPVTSFVLNKSDVTILAGETNVLAAIVGPEDATTTKVEWSSNNKEVVKVTDDGLLIGLKQGNAIVTAVLKDENGTHSATCKVTVPISLVVGVTDVKLNKTNMTLEAGSRETLTATLTPADATNTSVVWTSSDKNVATVNTNGRVTALAPGVSTITVTSVSGGEQATCKVTVTEPKDVSVTGVSLNTKTASLQVDQTVKLAAYVTPSDSNNQNVTWTSSNYQVADVSANGTVTAISPGTATITATTEDGGFTSTCTITVVKPVVKVTGVDLNKSLVILEKGDTEQLDAVITPIDADNLNVIWSSSNGEIVTVDETGLIEAKAYGEAIITARTEDGGYTKKCAVRVPAPEEVVAVTGITLSSNNLTITKDTTVDFTYNIVPANATNKDANIVFADKSVAKIFGKGIKGLKVGTTTLTVTSEDGNKTATCTITVVENTSGVSVTSEEYPIDDNNNIYDVPSGTNKEDFINNIDTEDGNTIQIKDKDGNDIGNTGTVGTGTQVVVTNPNGGNPITEAYTVIVPGDLNGDGEVTGTDFEMLKQHLIGKTTLSGIIFEAADLNEDSELNISDLALLQSKAFAVDSFVIDSNALGYVIELNPEQKGVAPGGTVDIYISARDLYLGTNNLRIIEGELAFDNTIFEPITETSITALNDWQFVYNANTKKIILNNNEEIEEYDNILKITLKAKNTVTTGNGEVSINNILTSNGTKEVNGTSEPITIFIEELSSTVYNITEDYKITNVAPDTLVSAFKQKITGANNVTIKDKNGNALNDNSKIGTGATLTTASGEVYTVIVKGDTDGDGTIGITDVSKVKLHYIGIELLQEPYLSAADVDLNGSITLTDVSQVKMHYIGTELIH